MESSRRELSGDQDGQGSGAIVIGLNLGQRGQFFDQQLALIGDFVARVDRIERNEFFIEV